ncbi:hypothetical protein EDD37DRAFT_53381 [Exophiala viscosa]|uniref:uncharacterized protein n=1 Tax=Exophiala viscosa TaxID=2486360 RepID=UPI00219AA0C4|nr:hypothetical protein EDD37DRAFT_53381 [Exophiala viscosa]
MGVVPAKRPIGACLSPMPPVASPSQTEPSIPSFPSTTPSISVLSHLFPSDLKPSMHRRFSSASSLPFGSMANLSGPRTAARYAPYSLHALALALALQLSPVVNIHVLCISTIFYTQPTVSCCAVIASGVVAVTSVLSLSTTNVVYIRVLCPEAILHSSISTVFRGTSNVFQRNIFFSLTQPSSYEGQSHASKQGIQAYKALDASPSATICIIVAAAHQEQRQTSEYLSDRGSSLHAAGSQIFMTYWADVSALI